MPKPLTLSQIAALVEEANTEGDDNVMKWVAPNLYLQSRANSKTWQLRWTEDGRIRSMGLGSAHLVAPAAALQLATKYREIARSGSDPRAVCKAERVAAKPGGALVAVASQPVGPTTRTFRDVARDYINAHEPGWKDPRHSTHWTRSLRQYAHPIIGDVAVGKVTVDHVVEVLKPIWREKHVTAGKVRTRIAQILDWAEAHKWRSGDNPARAKAVDIRLGNGVNRAVKHFAAVPYPRMPALWQALAADDSTAADVVRLMILTAMRPSEALGARWEEIDLDQRVWTVPGERMKMGHEHRAALSDEAVTLLRRRAAAATDATSGLIFPSTGGKMLDRAMPRKVIQRLGFDVTAHGCRSSFADWSREVAKADREVRELALAHRETNRAVSAYSRSDLLEARRPLMQSWADFVRGKSAPA